MNINHLVEISPTWIQYLTMERVMQIVQASFENKRNKEKINDEDLSKMSRR